MEQQGQIISLLTLVQQSTSAGVQQHSTQLPTSIKPLAVPPSTQRPSVQPLFGQPPSAQPASAQRPFAQLPSSQPASAQRPFCPTSIHSAVFSPACFYSAALLPNLYSFSRLQSSLPNLYSFSPFSPACSRACFYSAALRPAAFQPACLWSTDLCLVSIHSAASVQTPSTQTPSVQPPAYYPSSSMEPSFSHQTTLIDDFYQCFSGSDSDYITSK